jgi:multisubunit Na+/H+ antiporter MnhF subunit
MSLLVATAALLLGTGIALATYRLLVGPTTPDRLVAADTLAVTTTAGLAWLAWALDNAVYLDAALIYGALAFVGVVALARVLEEGPE